MLMYRLPEKISQNKNVCKMIFIASHIADDWWKLAPSDACEPYIRLELSGRLDIFERSVCALL